MAVKIMQSTVERITDGFFSFLGRRSVTKDRLTSSPSRHASAAAIKVIRTKTATTSSSVKDQERWMTLREKTFPTVRISISRVDTTRIQFSTAATAFMIFLNTFIDFSSFVACAVFVFALGMKCLLSQTSLLLKVSCFAPLALPQLPTTFAIRAIALLAHVVLPVQYP